MEKLNRPPIVVVLGHVDHGKTTLLDAIRKTNVVAKEAGGITQAIGASVVSTPTGKKITFIDTPGHAAFSKMRSRGAKVADIAILVVASDDGVQPQTKEALQIIKEAGIPFVVAATKIDIPGVNPELVRGGLEKEGILFEGRGGDTPFVPVSAKTGEGVKHLLEVITLLSEVHGIKGDPNSPLEAVVIESFKDPRGPMATLVVRNGAIKVRNSLFIQEKEEKVRALFDDRGKSIKEVLPGMPAQVMGFEEVPPVGAKVTEESKNEGIKEHKKVFVGGRLKKDEIAIVLKGGTAGALEAVAASLPQKVIVVASGVGDVIESDILMAKAAQALVVSFESKIPGSVARLAEAEKIRTFRFEVIYELIQKLEEILKEGIKEILGKAEILAEFPYENKRVAGCRITEGRIVKGESLALIREEKEIGKAKVSSMKKQKTEINQAKVGEEFGVILEPQLDFQIGDMLVSVAK